MKTTKESFMTRIRKLFRVRFRKSVNSGTHQVEGGTVTRTQVDRDMDISSSTNSGADIGTKGSYKSVKAVVSALITLAPVRKALVWFFGTKFLPIPIWVEVIVKALCLCLGGWLVARALPLDSWSIIIDILTSLSSMQLATFPVFAVADGTQLAKDEGEAPLISPSNPQSGMPEMVSPINAGQTLDNNVSDLIGGSTTGGLPDGRPLPLEDPTGMPLSADKISRLLPTPDPGTVYLYRLWKVPSAHANSAFATAGVLMLKGTVIAYTMEDQDRGISVSTPGTESARQKVKSRTAIPYGTYAVTVGLSFFDRAPDNGTNRGRRVLPRVGDNGTIKSQDGVTLFGGICIHSGKDDTWSEGCILAGGADMNNMARLAFTSYRTNELKLCEIFRKYPRICVLAKYDVPLAKKDVILAAGTKRDIYT